MASGRAGAAGLPYPPPPGCSRVHDGFEFKTSEWQMLKQIGNAVPPLLARALAAAVERALLRLDRKEKQALRLPERLILREQTEPVLLP